MISEDNLFTHDQFSFKNKRSFDFCIFTVKSVPKYFTQHSPAYTCFLDASKAFDKCIILNCFESYLIVKHQV